MAERIDFAEASLQDALDLAILMEEEAQERYLEFVHQMTSHATPDAAAFFQTMAWNEARHGEQLQVRRRELFRDAPRRVHRGMLWDVEAPEYDEARAFMSFRQALEVALRAESKAHAFFVQALVCVVDPQVRALFEELRDEEALHQGLVEELIAHLPPGPDPDPEDHVDEPVAQ